MRGLEPELFKTYRFSKAEPHVPSDLSHDILCGDRMIEIDEKLYFHIKFLNRSKIFFESEDRFAIRVNESGRDPSCAEFFIQDDRYFLRPPCLLEH